jgi:hypothetical protein
MYKKITALAFLFLLTLQLTACSNNIQQQVARHLEQGGNYLIEAQYELALSEYFAIIALDQGYIDAYIKIAEVYEAMAQYAEAVAILEDGLAVTGSIDIETKLTEVSHIIEMTAAEARATEEAEQAKLLAEAQAAIEAAEQVKREAEAIAEAERLKFEEEAKLIRLEEEEAERLKQEADKANNNPPNADTDSNTEQSSSTAQQANEGTASTSNKARTERKNHGGGYYDIYEYDANGVLSKALKYYPPNDYLLYEDFYTGGKISKMISYFGNYDGNTDGSYSISDNYIGNEYYKVTQYSADGGIINYWTYDYEFNEAGKMIKQIVYHSDGSVAGVYDFN